MIQAIKKLCLSFAAFGLFAAPVLVAPAAVYAQELGKKVQCGANLQLTPEAECNPDETGATERLNTIITTIVNVFSLIVGVVAVIMIIVGGLKYITSGGDSGNVSGAKNTILYAIVGLIIVALAQFIVRFVLAKATQTGP